ncbi:MAG: hypothetical protein HRT42_09370 [Campylobacteraceae bacterium]|nr:hypothetical protein [Campylobacteraceae bacterium]
MHAWAEVEHKLNYKSDAQVPDKFQRKLFRLSAKFEELRIGINEYKSNLKESILSKDGFDLSQDFNIESFKAFISLNFPDMPQMIRGANDNFDLCIEHNISFIDIDKAVKKLKIYYSEIRNDLIIEYKSNIIDSEIFIIILDIGIDSFYINRSPCIKEWQDIVKKWKNKIIDMQK